MVVACRYRSVLPLTPALTPEGRGGEGVAHQSLACSVPSPLRGEGQGEGQSSAGIFLK